MATLECDLIRFTNGDRAGELAVLWEREPVIRITDLDGNTIITWVDHDLMILEMLEFGDLTPEEEKEYAHQISEGRRVREWQAANKHSFAPLSDELRLKITKMGEAFISDIGIPMGLVVGQYAPSDGLER